MRGILCLSLAVGASCALADRIDSAHAVPLKAVTEGKVFVLPEHEAHAAALAREQLLYFVGHLNGFGGGADLAHARITVRDAADTTDGLKEVSYDAEFTVAWPRAYQAPETFRSVLPARTDGAGKKAFFQAFEPRCATKEEPASAGTFFYYYRPQMKGCPALVQKPDGTVALGATLALSPSPLETSGKKPEYDRVWEDGKLVATFVFGTYEHDAGNKDVGVLNYNRVYQALRRYLGRPVSMNVNLAANAEPGLRHRDVEMTFRYSGDREVNVNLLLIRTNDLHKPPAAFLRRYEERTQVSDVLAYNGHSGLGANIRALARIGKFTPGQYRLFLVNGCDTFTYVDDSLTEAVAAANPGEAGTRYLDLIVNAMPSQFNDFAQNAVVLVRALFERQATYRQLLSGMAAFQKALVTGEEDNP